MRLSHVLALGAALSMAVSAAPLPFSAVGDDKAIVIHSKAHNAATNGGGFNATVDGNANALVWCIDDENFVNVPDSFNANVVAFEAWDGDKVRKGNNTTWKDGEDYTTLQRYQAAAWLLDTFMFSNLGNSTVMKDVQHAIWDLTSTTSTLTSGGNTYYTQALGFLNSAASANYGFGKWAVISGPSLNGELSKDAKQTLLVQVEAGPSTETPEPASMALIGAGLAGIALYNRRRKA